MATPSGLLRRYSFDDGFGETTSAFTICSLWMVEALARIGKEEDARTLFELVLSHANDVGLLSEDIDPTTGELWGNFPQTYSHFGVINAAFALDAAAR